MKNRKRKKVIKRRRKNPICKKRDPEFGGTNKYQLKGCRSGKKRQLGVRFPLGINLKTQKMAKKKKNNALKVTSLSKVRKNFSSGLASEISLPPDHQLWLPSRSLMLNYTLGGGIPYGRIAEIFGTESSGKTLIAQDFGYVAQKVGGIILWNDAEQSFTPYWAEQNGLDNDRIELCNEVAVEHVSDWLLDMVVYYRSQLTNNQPILFIQDSTAALDGLENINSRQSDAKAEMGNRAKAIYKMVRIRNKMLTELGVVSIFINQIRHKVGASQFEDPDTTPGGNAMKFYAAQRVGVYAGKQIKEKVNGIEDRVGIETSIRLKKNKVAPPRPTFKTRIYFHGEYHEPVGIDRYIGLADVFLRLGVVEKKGITYYLDGDSICKGEINFNELIREDKNLRKHLIKLSPIHTLSKLKKQLKSLDVNLFPVGDSKYSRHDEDGSDN